MHLFQLGLRARDGRPVAKISRPFMERLLERFQETVNLAARHDDKLIIVEALESTRSIKKGAAVGEQDTWHSSSLGKAILAFLPREEARTILERRGFQPYTPKTFITFPELCHELERVRELGYAIDDEEGEEGMRCVGAPVFDHRGQVSYAISLSGPANRFSPERIRETGREIRIAAASISSCLGCTQALARGGNDAR
jgi:IclR family acetate operon transcriptional repressor